MSSIAGTRRADIAIPVSGVLAATAIGIGVALLDPQLAGSTPPHPTLTGSLGDALWVVQNNARVLAVPFLLVAFGFPERQLGRCAGDLIVSALVGASAIPVGLELGRWGPRLVPYLPQLPFEWAALALSVHAWVRARRGHPSIRQLAPLAATVLSLLAGAAALETWGTPHRPDHDPIAHTRPASGPGLSLPPLRRVWKPELVACRPIVTDHAARSLQGRTLPSPRCARFRSAARSAFRALSTTGSPQGGNQR
jgi:hypothetical protein